MQRNVGKEEFEKRLYKPGAWLVAFGVLFITLGGLTTWLVQYVTTKSVDYMVMPLSVLGLSFSGLLAINGWWLRHWHRDIVGYDAIFWLNEAKEAAYGICLRGEELDMTSFPPGAFIFRVPLGGWFRKPGRVMKNTEGSPSLELWRVRFERITGPANEIHVILRLYYGLYNSFRWNAREALACFTNTAACTYGYVTADAIVHVGVDLKPLYDKATAKIAQLTGLLEEAIDRIRKTDRFTKSKEGRAVRLWLVSQILEHLPENDPRRPVYKKMLPRERVAPSEAPESHGRGIDGVI
ncbi:MAG: hypothetical protein Q7S89_03140 [bacterium]|nr:hypothetical protein [bacterium]